MVKVFVAIAAIACPLLMLGVGWWIGLATAYKAEAKSTRRKFGVTKAQVQMLPEAMTLLNSLVSLTSIHGDLGDTRLGERDTARVKDLVARYEKEISKK